MGGTKLRDDDMEKRFGRMGFPHVCGCRPMRSGLGICVAVGMLCAALLPGGCTPGASGTRVEPKLAEISRIQKIGLYVKVQHGFAVRLQYVSNADRGWLEQGLVGSLGRFLGAAMFGGVFGLLAEYSPDRNATVRLQPQSAPVDSEQAIGSALLNMFRIDNVFPAGELLQSGSPVSAGQRGNDAVLIFAIRRWGLRPPLGSRYEKGDQALAQLELNVHLKLVSSATQEVLWEREEPYVDSDCYRLGDFTSQEGLLARRMEHALQQVCHWTANEIHRTSYYREAKP